MTILVLVLSALIGISLGLLGGGGSILAVPMLTYAAGLSPKEAIATSLLVIGLTALGSLIQHARRGNVEWITGLTFALTAMIGAYGGGRIAQAFDGKTLLLLFVGMMATTAVAMFRGPSQHENRRTGVTSPTFVIIEGLVVGAATGLVGAGGGFLVVPALVLLGGMPMHRAIGTSLFVIVLKSFSALAGHTAHVTIDVELAASVSLSALGGSMLGTRLAAGASPERLRRIFSVFVMGMALYIVAREVRIEAALTLAFIFVLLTRTRSRRSQAPSVVGPH